MCLIAVQQSDSALQHVPPKLLLEQFRMAAAAADVGAKRKADELATDQPVAKREKSSTGKRKFRVEVLREALRSVRELEKLREEKTMKTMKQTQLKESATENQGGA